MRFLDPVPLDRRPLVRQGIAVAHRHRLRIIAPLLILLSVYLIVVDFWALAQRPDALSFEVFLRIDLGFLVVNLVALGLTSWDRRGVALGTMVVYTALVMVWAAIVGAVEYHKNENFTTLLLAMLATATTVLFPGAAYAGVVVGTLVVYAGISAWVPGFRMPDLETASALVSVAVVAFAVSRVLYRATVINILTTAEVREARLNLIRQEKLASLGVLAAGIAHEINNPLSFIKSNLAVLERNQDPLTGDPAVLAENRQIFAETREGFQRISDVVRALSSFTRGAQGALVEPYDLNEGVRTTVALTRHETKDGLSLDVLLGDVPLVPARGSEVNQVILNLLINALQAVRSRLDPTTGRVGVRTLVADGSVVLEVWNNGPPIPPELRERIFEPFFSTKEPGAGMGLGLSLAWEIIVGRHGGTLEVTQDAARNVTFRMTLPLG